MGKNPGCAVLLLLCLWLPNYLNSGCLAQAQTSAVEPASVAESGTNGAAAIIDLNDEFRKDYANARKLVREGMFPVILLQGDKVVLLQQAARDERIFIPAAWSVLKTVDHAALAIFVLLQAKTDSQLSQETLIALTALRERVEAAKQSVGAALKEESQLGVGVVARNEKMLAQCADFIDSCLQERAVSRRQLNAFAAALAKPSMQNADDAEMLELSRLDRTVQAWRQQMPAEQWHQLHVLIMGGHMPREQDRLTQYFSLLLGDKREGKHIVYAEGLDDVNKALDLLATHLLDERIAVAYFNDPWRMHRDLLSDAARRYLQKHPPACSFVP